MSAKVNFSLLILGTSLIRASIDLTTKGYRKVTAEEIYNVEELRKIYSNVSSALMGSVELADEVPPRPSEATKPYSAYSTFKMQHRSVSSSCFRNLTSTRATT